MKNTTSAAQPFQTIENAAKLTGVSMYFLRKGCRAGSIPCIKSGPKYLILMSGLMEALEAEAKRKERLSNDQ